MGFYPSPPRPTALSSRVVVLPGTNGVLEHPLRLSGDDVEVALRFDGCTVTTRAAMTVLESREGGEPANPPDGDWKDWFETCVGCTVVVVRRGNDELRLVLDDGRELWMRETAKNEERSWCSSSMTAFASSSDVTHHEEG